MLPVNVYYDDLLQLLAATGTYWTPTLAVAFRALSGRVAASDSHACRVEARLSSGRRRCLPAPIQSIPRTTTAKRCMPNSRISRELAFHRSRYCVSPRSAAPQRWEREICWAAWSPANWLMSCCSTRTLWMTLRTPRPSGGLSRAGGCSPNLSRCPHPTKSNRTRILRIHGLKTEAPPSCRPATARNVDLHQALRRREFRWCSVSTATCTL